jgi:hypothetical protein
VIVAAVALTLEGKPVPQSRGRCKATKSGIRVFNGIGKTIRANQATIRKQMAAAGKARMSGAVEVQLTFFFQR